MKKLLIVIVGCIAQLTLAMTPRTVSADQTKRKVGVIVPLTGPLAFFGKDFIRSFESVTEDHPEITKFLDVKFEDSAYDSKLAITAFNKLVSIDNVDLVYSFGGPMLSVLAPVAEAKKIPFFATESEIADCEKKDFCSLFRSFAMKPMNGGTRHGKCCESIRSLTSVS